jgi:hypothetical protein
VLVITDVERHGLRPWLTAIGVLKSQVNHRTKQSDKEWSYAAAAAGWRPWRIDTYLPFAVRRWNMLFGNALGRYTVSTRYTIYLRNPPDREPNAE